MTDVSDVLGTHPFFFGLSAEQLDAVAGCAAPATFDAGVPLFHAGEEADGCYLIVDGDVALELVAAGRGPHVIQTIHAGDMLGWSWLFPPHTWKFDAQALTYVRAVRFDGTGLRAASDEDTDLGYTLLRRFTQVIIDRMQAARLQLMDIYGDPR